MNRGIRVAAALLGVQVLFFGIYSAVQHRRGHGCGAAAPLTLGQAAPELIYRTRDPSSQNRLSGLRGRAFVLHFWATWCPPCREELPGLLAFAEQRGIEVLAVSLDPDWESVGEFFGREPPRTVVLADADAVGSAFDVAVLPVTYVVDAAGDLRLRLSGSRDWSTSTARQGVLDALSER